MRKPRGLVEVPAEKPPGGRLGGPARLRSPRRARSRKVLRMRSDASASPFSRVAPRQPARSSNLHAVSRPLPRGENGTCSCDSRASLRTGAAKSGARPCPVSPFFRAPSAPRAAPHSTRSSRTSFAAIPLSAPPPLPPCPRSPRVSPPTRAALAQCDASASVASDEPAELLPHC